MTENSKLTDLLGRTPLSFWLCVIVLLFTGAALCAKPVPFNNEFLYILRLEPGFLPNDWSFSQAAAEHWLFNTLFQLPAYIMPVESVAWAGRIIFWLLCIIAIIRLAEHWEIPHWAVAVSVGMWLAVEQAVVNAEWIFGTFEAKPVAYACLLFALDGFSRGKTLPASLLLGLSFSFHPAVGLWAIPSVGLALLLLRTQIPTLAKVVGLTVVGALPGLIPLFAQQTAGNAASFDDWRFIVTTHMPFHFDPFDFAGLAMALLAVMLAFNVAVLWRTESYALRFLRNFQLAIAGFFVFGVLLRVFEMYPLLRFMPMRLFPILTPLFFLFTVCHCLVVYRAWTLKIAIAVGTVVIFVLLAPFDNGFGQLRDTREKWILGPDDIEKVLIWSSRNTPPDALMLTTPVNRKVWYLSKRAQVVSYLYPRYDRLGEWRSRVRDVTGGIEVHDRMTARDSLQQAFDGLSLEQVDALRQKYSATHFVSTTQYPLPILFASGEYKLYRLQ